MVRARKKKSWTKKEKSLWSKFQSTGVAEIRKTGTRVAGKGCGTKK